jgi:hypothetical protein
MSFIERDDFPMAEVDKDTKMHQLLRTIMGDRFMDAQAWNRLFGAGSVTEEPTFSPKLLDILDENCRIKHGKKIRDSHLLFFVPKLFKGETLTLSKWSQIIQNDINSPNRSVRFTDEEDTGHNWWLDEQFAHTGPEESQWILMPIDPIPGMTNKDWGEQQDYLKESFPEYNMMGLLELVTGTFLYYFLTGNRLLSSLDYRTTTTGSANISIGAGEFSAYGFRINPLWEGNGEKSWSAAACRKI